MHLMGFGSSDLLEARDGKARCPCGETRYNELCRDRLIKRELSSLSASGDLIEFTDLEI
jgi:hypothetical protein